MPTNNTEKNNNFIELACRPILKWAGGKSQMLVELMPRVPKKYGRFIEPFFGGGALFFALRPEQAIIADSNPELINLYRTVANNVEGVIVCLKRHKNEEDAFYKVRAQDWTKQSPEKAAARTIPVIIFLRRLSGLNPYFNFPKRFIKT